MLSIMGYEFYVESSRCVCVCVYDINTYYMYVIIFFFLTVYHPASIRIVLSNIF